MEYKRYSDKTVIRLDKGEDIIESLIAVAREENIKAGVFSGIGATDSFEIGVFSLEKQDYDRFSFSENHEITELSGNITTVEGKPYIHAHINCASHDGKIVGGHLFKARISLTCEIFITEVDGEISREFDEELRINRLKF